MHQPGWCLQDQGCGHIRWAVRGRGHCWEQPTMGSQIALKHAMSFVEPYPPSWNTLAHTTTTTSLRLLSSLKPTVDPLEVLRAQKRMGKDLISALCACMLSHLVMSDSVQPHELYSLPGSSVHGILQERILEWVATPSSRGPS